MSCLETVFGRVVACLVLVVMLIAWPGQSHAQDDYLRGPLIRELSFSGNRAIDDVTLRVSIGTSESSSFARWGLFKWLGAGEKRYFNETEFRRDSARIVLLYRRSGYRDVEVDMNARYSGDDVYLRFFIDEGEPVRVDTLEIFGLADIADESDVLRKLPLRVGDPFNLLLVQASQDSIGAYLRNRGYPFAEVYPNYSTNLGEYSATLRFTADPGPRARVASIDVHGAQEVDEDVIRQAMSVRPGDWYNQSDLYKSQIDLYGLNMFNLVDVGLADTTDIDSPDTTVALQVNVAEAALHQIRLGPGYGTVDCFRALGAWTAYDFMGGGRTLDLSARLSKLGASEAGLHKNICRGLQNEPIERRKINYTLSASLTEPFFFTRDVGAALTFTAERYSEPQAFVVQSIGGEASLTWRTPLEVPVTFLYGLSQAKTEADDAIFCFFLNVCRPEDAAIYTEWLLRSEVGLLFSWDRTNSLLNANRGFRLTGDLRHASQALGSDSLVQFTRGSLEFVSHHRVLRRGVFSWRVRVAAVSSPQLRHSADSLFRFLTPDDRLYGGGSNSVRGFSHNELGPIVQVLDTIFELEDSLAVDAYGPDKVAAYPYRSSATGGDRLFFANAEYRFPLPLLSGRVFGAFFVDAGMVNEHALDVDSLNFFEEHFRITPGIGFRVMSALGPMRLDIGFNPYPPQESPKWYYEAVEPIKDEEGKVIEDRYTLRELVNMAGQPPPNRGFFDRFRIHFSVGQAF